MDHITTPADPSVGELRRHSTNMQEDLHQAHHHPPPPVPPMPSQFSSPRPAPRPQPQLQRHPGHQLRNKSPAITVVQALPKSKSAGQPLQKHRLHIPVHDGPNATRGTARRARRPQYRPLALSWPFLTALILSLFVLAGLLAVSLRILPIQRTDSLGNQMAKRAQADHQNRGRSTPLGIAHVRNLTVPLASHTVESVRLEKKAVGSRVPDTISVSSLNSAEAPSNSARPALSFANDEMLNQVYYGLVFYSGFLYPGKHTITFHHQVPRRTKTAVAPVVTTPVAMPVSPADPGETDITMTKISPMIGEVGYSVRNSPGVQASLALGKRTTVMHPESPQRTEVPTTKTSALSYEPEHMQETVVFEIPENFNLDLGSSAIIPLGERAMTMLEGAKKGAGLDATMPSNSSSKVSHTTGVPSPGWSSGSSTVRYKNPGAEAGPGPGAFLHLKEYVTIYHKLAMRHDATFVPAATSGERNPALSKLVNRSVVSDPTVSSTRPSEGFVTTAPGSIVSDPIHTNGGSASPVLDDPGKGVKPAGFLRLGKEIWHRAADKNNSAWQAGDSASLSSALTATVAGETITMTGLPTTTTLGVQNHILGSDNNDCCQNGVHPGGFLILGPVTIFNRAESVPTTVSPVTTKTPLYSRGASYETSIGKLSGIIGDAAYHGPFLRLKETIILGYAEGLGQELDPFERATALSNKRRAFPTAKARPLPVPSMEPASQPGMKSVGFLRVGKQTITVIKEMAKRSEALLPHENVESHSDQIPFHTISTMESVVDGAKIAIPTSVSTAAGHLSETHGLPTAHYLPFRNQSATTRLGRHETPASVSSALPTHFPVSTARPPLNTSQPVPQATTAEVTIKVYDLTFGTYFVCFFLPTLLCTLLQIPVRLVDQAVRLLQPFHALADPDGGIGRDSLWLETAGWRCRVASLRHVFSRKQSLVFLTSILQILTWLVTTFSATAVGLELVGSGCQQGDPYSVENNCAMTPAVFLRPTIIMLSLLGSMVVVLAIIMGRLLSWDTGVHEDPWSIAGTARLSLNKELRSRMQLVTPGTTEEREAQSSKFALSYFEKESKLRKGYGVVPFGTDQSLTSTRPLPSTVTTFLTTSSTWINEKSKTVMGTRQNTKEKEKLELPFTLGYTGRILFLVFMCGLMIVILYYRNVSTPSGFEDFMDDESYGVTILFTGVGTVATEFWSSFAEDIAIISPYHCLATSSNKAPGASLYLSRPTHALSGVRIAFLRRHWFLLFVSLTSIAAEFLPIFLSNIPYNMTQLYVVYVDCYYISIAILSLMTTLVVASFFVRWTKLPADPLTLAGAMYHVIDSNILEELADRVHDDDDEYEGAGGQRKKVLAPMPFKGVSVAYRAMIGMSGKIRTQVGITNLSA